MRGSVGKVLTASAFSLGLAVTSAGAIESGSAAFAIPCDGLQKVQFPVLTFPTNFPSNTARYIIGAEIAVIDLPGGGTLQYVVADGTPGENKHLVTLGRNRPSSNINGEAQVANFFAGFVMQVPTTAAGSNQIQIRIVGSCEGGGNLNAGVTVWVRVGGADNQ